MVSANSMSRLIPLLVLLSGTVSSCNAFTLGPFLPRSVSHQHDHQSRSWLGLKQHGSRSLKLRGGAFLKEQKNNDCQDQKQWRRPPTHHVQQLSFVGVIAPPLKLITGSILGVLGLIRREILGLSSSQKLFFVATFCLGFFLGRLRPFWKRYTDVNDIPKSLFGNEAPALRGRAVSVSDGDTIRFLHQPTRFHPSELAKGQKVSEFALPIRLCTIDTPETAKFGKPGQPFGPEAKQHLKSLLEDKVVHIRLLQKDQYSRAVAQVFTKKVFPFFGKRYMDEAMLEEGLAEVYTGGGAVYGPLGKDGYMGMMEEARKAKKGIWSQKHRETAAEYKRRTKQ